METEPSQARTRPIMLHVGISLYLRPVLQKCICCCCIRIRPPAEISWALNCQTRGKQVHLYCNPSFHKELLRLEAAWTTLSLYAQCCYVRRHRKQSDEVRLSLVTLTMHRSSEVEGGCQESAMPIASFPATFHGDFSRERGINLADSLAH